MSNHYLQPDVAQSYEELPKQLTSFVVSPFVLRALGLADDQPGHLLDYGCGTGEFASRFCERFPHLRITAVDESAEMIKLAEDRHAHPHIQYHLIEDDSLSFLPDHSMNMAIVLFVLINVSSQQRILHLLQEISRVLKARALLVVLDPHPDGLGKQFLDYRRGEPGILYQPGDSYPVQFFSSGVPTLQVHNYYWSKEVYLEMLSTAGFSQVEITEPTLKGLEREKLAAFETIAGSCSVLTEWDSPPYLVLRAIKPVQ